MATNRPLVSVVLPFYNGEQYLSEAIQSILDQTYENFELLIVSSPNTNQASLDIVKSFSDKRIRHLAGSTEQNNLPKQLNLGLDQSRGVYIARMDADDISLRNRLEEEVCFMEKNLDIGIVGSWARSFGMKTNTIKHPSDPEEIRANLLFQSSLVHPTVMMRRDKLNEYSLRYNPELRYCEDIDFWARAAGYLKISNIKKILLLYRTHEEQGSRQDIEEQLAIKDNVRRRQLAALNIYPNVEEIKIHRAVCASQGAGTLDELQDIACWIYKISMGNSVMSIYNQIKLDNVLGERWFISCYSSAKTLRRLSWKCFWSHSLSKFLKPRPRNMIRVAKFFITSHFH